MAVRRPDPELLRQLDEARGTTTPVAVNISIRRKRGKPPIPTEIEAAAHSAVARASQATGTAANDVHVLGHMAIAYVTGPETLIRELLAQPEITGATPNQRPTPPHPTPSPPNTHPPPD